MCNLPMTLNHVPQEVLENIVRHVDVPKDLLNLALVNRYFFKVIIQSYIQTWRIRCVTNTTVMWSKLASLPELCTRIREIHLYEQFRANAVEVIRSLPRLGPIIPPLFRDNDWDIQHFWPDIPRVNWDSWERKRPFSFMSMLARARSTKSTTDPQDCGTTVSTPVQPVEMCSNGESLSYFCSILPLIKNLTKVVLVFPLEGSAPKITPPMMKSVLDSLVRYNSGCLRSVVIVWASYGNFDLDTDYVFSSLWTLSNLIQFRLKLAFYCKTVDSEAQASGLCNLLVNQCPDLEELGLEFEVIHYSNHINYLWEKATWKRLCSLQIGGNVSHRDSDLLPQFLARHPGLEYLQYGYEDVLELEDYNLLLQNLRGLNLFQMPMTQITLWPESERPVQTFKNVEYLMVRDADILSDTPIVKFYFPSLRVLIMPLNLRNLGRGLNYFLPETLERLCIKLVTRRPDYGELHDRLAKEFVNGILKKPCPLQKLTHLCIVGYRLTYSVTSFQSEKILRKISTLPSLKYFGLENHYNNASQSWIRLIRSPSGRYAGYEIDNSVELVSQWWSF